MSKTGIGRELTATELARAAGIRIDGLYVSLRSGKIPARKDSSGEWKITARAFERYMLQRSGRVARNLQKLRPLTTAIAKGRKRIIYEH